jgi:hypothetical protein
MKPLVKIETSTRYLEMQTASFINPAKSNVGSLHSTSLMNIEYGWTRATVMEQLPGLIPMAIQPVVFMCSSAMIFVRASSNIHLRSAKPYLNSTEYRYVVYGWTGLDKAATLPAMSRHRIERNRTIDDIDRMKRNDVFASCDYWIKIRRYK